MPERRDIPSALSSGHIGVVGPMMIVSAFFESSSRRGRVLFMAALAVMMTISQSGRRYSQAESG